ncbi:hypothetical protein AD998_11485 [bacterium 336/3]|nr:hypothetical protein AD998_11485 [bacterium 336/3]
MNKNKYTKKIINKSKDTKKNIIIFMLLGVLIFSLTLIMERFMRGEVATPNNLADFYYSSGLGWFLLLFTEILLFTAIIIIFYGYIIHYITSFGKWVEVTTFLFFLVIIIYFLIQGNFSVYGYAYKIEKLYTNNHLLYVFDYVEHSSKYGNSYVYRKHTFNAKTLERVNREVTQKDATLNYPSYKVLSSDDLPSYILENKDHYDAIEAPITITIDDIIIIANKGCLFQLDKKTKNILRKIRL